MFSSAPPPDHTHTLPPAHVAGPLTQNLKEKYIIDTINVGELPKARDTMDLGLNTFRHIKGRTGGGGGECDGVPETTMF